MTMKKTMFFILAIAATAVQAQYVHINMYVELKKDMDTTDDGPWLVIQYKNNYRKPVYLPKLACPYKGYPFVESYLHLSPFLDEDGKPVKASSPKPYDTSNYVVRINPVSFDVHGKRGLEAAYIEMMQERLTGEGRATTSDCDLAGYHIAAYTYEKRKRKPKDTKDLPSIMQEMLRSHVFNGDRELLVFLSPGEVHCDRFNLSAFKKQGGSYSFAIEASTTLDKGGLDSSVVVYYNKPFTVWDAFYNLNISFPGEIDGYQFYGGAIYAGSTHVKFVE